MFSTFCNSTRTLAKNTDSLSRRGAYLDFLGLVVDDGLLLLDGRLQGLVALQKRLAKLCRQLKI
jgi:hypothetical protein